MTLSLTPQPVSAFEGEMLSDFRRQALTTIAAALLFAGVLLEGYAEMASPPLQESRLGIALVILSMAVWVLAGRCYRGASWLLVVGCAAADLLAFSAHPMGATLALLALPTGLAAFLLGAGGGTAAAACWTLLLVLLAGRLGLTAGALAPILAAIWGTLAVVWLTERWVLQAIRWAWASYEQVRSLLAEAREQRVELKQTQEDLVHANRELARLSERLEAMYQVAEEARRAKGEFVANVSHELRTPLNMVIGYCEMITHAPDYYGGLPPRLLADIAAIERNARHLSGLIDDVLDISQIEANRMALNKEPASLAEIVAGAVEAVQGFYQSKGLSLQTELPAGLPTVVCDPLRIRQVLLNLLSNAGRFCEQGNVLIRVQQEGPRLVISVSDTGPGIPPEQQGTLFEPFRQLEGPSRRRKGGSGLGLSICKRFVELHGGSIWLKSAPGEGTTVSFALPVSDGAGSPLAGDAVTRYFSPYIQYEPRWRRSRAPAPDTPPRFVVLEQGQALQRLLRRHLNGVEVVAVDDTAAALAELNRSPAQALLINTPLRGKGHTDLPAALAAPYGTPVIACWVPGQEEAMRDLGVVHYLVKPVAREALLGGLAGFGGDVRTVLVVDDDEEALQLYARMLSSARRGYRLLRAGDGGEALALLRRQRPDVMVLDLMMPGMDGLELLRRKAEDPDLRSIPVIVVSARVVTGEHLVSNTIVASRRGLTVRDLIGCICTLSEALAPAPHTPDRGPSERPAG